MRLGPAIYGALLCVALVISYQSWTRTDEVKPQTGDHLVWNHSGNQVSLVRYVVRYKSVRLEQRSDEQGRYLWGTHTKYREGEADRAYDDAVEKARKAEKEGLDAGTAAMDELPALPPLVPGEDNPREVISSRQFPVGDEGAALVEQFEKLMALRSLGRLDQAQLEEYELARSPGYLQIRFADGSTESLVIGKKVYGGSDRYALHQSSGQAYVVAMELIRPMDSAQSMLSLKKVHAFTNEEVATIEVDTPASKKTLNKTMEEDEAGVEHVVWTDAEKPQGGDQMLTNFVVRAAKLRPSEYDPELSADQLMLIATMRYKGDKGNEMGFIQLYRQTPQMQDQTQEIEIQTQYYLRSERTHSLAKVSRLGAQRVDQDLVQIFGIEEAPPPIDNRPQEVPEALDPNAKGTDKGEKDAGPGVPSMPTEEEMRKGINSIQFPKNLPKPR